MIARPEDIAATYERQAARYDAGRARVLFEAGWLTRFAEALPRAEGPAAHVLDLGCGAGEPIAAWLMSRGLRVTGVDIAAAMLGIARSRWPDGDWRQGDMRALALGTRFEGIVAWDSFFHLTPDDQRRTIAAMAAHLRPGGVLMLTVGPEAGEAEGRVGEEAVYHASLSPAGYAACLEENGMRMMAFLAEDPEADFHSVLMARRTGRAER